MRPELCTDILAAMMRPGGPPRLADIGGPPIEAVALVALIVAGLVVAGVVVLVVFVLRSVTASRPKRAESSPCPTCLTPVPIGQPRCQWCGAIQPALPDDPPPPPVAPSAREGGD